MGRVYCEKRTLYINVDVLIRVSRFALWAYRFPRAARPGNHRPEAGAVRLVGACGPAAPTARGQVTARLAASGLSGGGVTEAAGPHRILHGTAQAPGPAARVLVLVAHVRAVGVVPGEWWHRSHQIAKVQ